MNRSMRIAQSICGCVAAAALIIVWLISPNLWAILASLALAGVTTKLGVFLVVMTRRGDWNE
jgi:hypothetical protein